MSKKDISIFIGNILDHFDTALYAFLAPVFAPVFFNGSGAVMQLIHAYSILAISILIRPIGVIIFGNIARTRGAAAALSYSLVGMAVVTVFIGLLPGYRTIGCLAPILLILSKIFGEIFAAGEVSVSKLYILEDKASYKAFNASWFYPISSMSGIILAGIVSNITIACGGELWRIGFILGGLTGVAGYILRKYAAGGDIKLPASIAALPNFWQHRIIIFKAAVISGFSYLTYVIPFVLMNSFLPLVADVSFQEMMERNSILLVFDVLMIPVIGKLTVRLRPDFLMKAAVYMLLATIIPLWWGLPKCSIYYASFVCLWIIILGVMFLVPLNLCLHGLLKSSDKYTLIGMGTALGDAIIGRTAPAICLYLWYATGNVLSIAVYIAALALLTLAVLRKT